MECNKDEAVKAKKIAEQKLTEKDIAGAQKFALKAKNMFPGLDGISQFLEIINVYVAHERKKTNGEVDFYGVLSVEPSADDQTIRKHYTRLALALHPDKNQSVGADGAFNIISEAWGLLSDRTKRMMYDNKNGSSASGVKLLTAKAGMSTLKTDAGFVPDSVSTCSKADRLVKRRRLARSSKELYDLETHNLLENKARMDILAFLSKREKEVAKKKNTSPVFTAPVDLEPEAKSMVIPDSVSTCSKADRLVKRRRLARSSKELYDLETRNLLENKARMDILAFLSKREKEVAKKKKTSPVFTAPVDLEPEAKSMVVPDSDFHSFDENRMGKCFGGNQIWATYDADDCMPRNYALVHNVLSAKPFKVNCSWLNSKSNSELSPINWVGSGFLKTSGDFRIGRRNINKMLNSFSHKVKWVKGPRGVIQIFPQKGDVWALYRHRSPEWNELIPEDIIYKYDMVEVLGDYTEKEGVTVAPLVKVAGFISVFRRQLDPKYLRHIPREEMFRFSHQVPSYLLTGEEAPNAPTGCWELDPAALPLELHRVMTDAEIEALGKVADASNL